MTRRPNSMLIALGLLLVFSLPAAAQTSWAVAERTDEQISSLLSKLDPYVEKLGGADEAPGVILYHQVQVAPELDKSRICRNLVIRVNDPAALPDELLRPWNQYGGEVESSFGFVRSGDDYRRLKNDEMPYVEGREDIGRDRFDFQWGEMRKGDVVGWSTVVKLQSPPMSVTLGLAEKLPMVIANLNVRSQEKLGYKVHTSGVTTGEVDIKEQDVVDRRAMVIKASANQRAATHWVPTEEPYPDSYPHMVAVLEEVYVESSNPMVREGWASRQGWNTLTTMIAGLVDKSEKDTGGLSITLSAITTGANDYDAKAAAITKWVSEKITLLEGPDIVRSGIRDAEKVFKSKEGTEFEMVLLAATMMRQAGVKATIGLLRRPELGALDHEWRMMDQFSDAVVRTEGLFGPLYWAPQCTSCEPGTLPASFDGAELLVHDANLPEIAREFQEHLMKEARIEGKFDLGAIQTKVEEQPWHRFEIIGG